MTAPTAIRGIVFDLDGTLVDSGLDFDAMRREMGLTDSTPILEAMAHMEEAEAARCRDILARHEWEGARRARLMPGVAEFLDVLSARGIRRAILTRNARHIAQATLERLELHFERLVAREDAPAKPDPTALWDIAAAWQLDRPQLAIVGDFRFDIEAGRRAGIRTVLYTAGQSRAAWADWEPADYYLDCFTRPDDFLRWLDQPT